LSDDLKAIIGILKTGELAHSLFQNVIRNNKLFLDASDMIFLNSGVNRLQLAGMLPLLVTNLRL